MADVKHPVVIHRVEHLRRVPLAVSLHFPLIYLVCLLSRSMHALEGSDKISILHDLYLTPVLTYFSGPALSWALGGPTACIPEKFLPRSIPTRKETKQNNGNKAKIKSQ